MVAQRYTFLSDEAAPGAAYFRKPFEGKALLAAIRRAIKLASR
jgi:hypothetical protein